MTVVVNYLAQTYWDTGGNITGTVNIGTQHDTKLIVAAVSINAGGANITAGTLASVSGTLYENQTFDGTNRHLACVVWELPTQSGSQSFTINCAANCWSGCIHWFEVLNAEPVPADTANDIGIPLSTTVTAVADGAVVNSAHGYSTGDTIAFGGSGWTLSSQNTAGGNVVLSGYNYAAAGSFTINTTFSPGNTGQAQITLAFEPLPGGPFGYTITAAAGSYALAGTTATLTKAGAAPVVVNYITQQTTLHDSSGPHTGTVDIGAQNDTKLIVAAVSTMSGSAPVSTATLGGVSATQYEYANLDGGTRHFVFLIWEMPSQSGSQSFTINFSGSVWTQSTHWYEVLDAEPVPVDGANDVTNEPRITTVTAVADGAILSAFTGHNVADAPTFYGTGWTETYDGVSSHNTLSGFNYAAAGSFVTTANFPSGLLLGTLAFKSLAHAAHALAGDIGSYQLDGTDATLTRAGGAPHYLVIAEAWEPAAPLLRSLQLPAQTHTYELAGTDATQTKSEGVLATRREFAIASAPYAVFINETTTGREYGVYGTYLNEAGASPPGVLEAYPGSYTLTGTAATLTKTTVGAGGGDYFGNRYFGARYFGDRYWGIGEAAAALSIAADAGAYALAGTAATPKHGWKVIATTVGAYALTGTGATLQRKLSIVAVSGSYAITGTAATPLHRWKITATTVGAYTLAGTAATPTKIARYTIDAAAGSYALAGTTATTLHRWKSTATTVGAYALTGTAATLTKGKRLIALAGSYALTGTAASPLHRWKTTALAGSYALAGTAAGTWRGRKAVALAGSYALAGSGVTILSGRRAEAEAGSYVLTGTDVFLDFSAFVPIPVAGLRVVYADDESRAVEANFAGAVPRIVHATPPRIART